MGQPSILSTPEVATLTGKSRATVWRLGMRDPRWSGCILRQTKHSTDWSRSRLIAAGLICEQALVESPVVGLSFDVPLMTWAAG